MKKSLIAVLALLLMSVSVVHAEASATTKKKTHASKQTAKVKVTYKPGVKKTLAARNNLRKASFNDDGPLEGMGLQSSAFLVQDQATGSILLEKNSDAVLPIASITKLMSAMVTLDSAPNLREIITITEEDLDTLKFTRSRLKVGTQLTREEMLRLSLMASENRATAALSRYYPGGRPAFIAAMNRKAQSLGLYDTQFQDPTGLTSANVSSARDLVKMVSAAHQYPLIREFSTTPEFDVLVDGRVQSFHNTNSLVRSAAWDIGLSKTGFINEAGKCLVMQAWFNQKPMIIVLLDSWGKMTRIGDANRIKKWVEHAGVSPKPKSS